MFKTKIRALHLLVQSAGALLLAGCATREPLSSFERGQRENPDHISFIRNLKPYGAGSDQTAFASLATVMRYWKIQTPPAVIERTTK